MVKSVGEGVFVGTDKQVLFYPGDPLKSKEVEVVGAPIVPGSGVTINKLNLKGVEIGKAVLFHTEIGAFLGLPDGRTIDLTSAHYAVQDVEEGMALIRWNNGYRQYIFMAQAPAEIAGTAGAGELPAFSGSGSGATA
jgi:hypothetical protein